MVRIRLSMPVLSLSISVCLSRGCLSMNWIALTMQLSKSVCLSMVGRCLMQSIDSRLSCQRGVAATQGDRLMILCLYFVWG